MGAYYRRILDHALGALLRVQFRTRGSDVVDYAVVLLLETEKGAKTIRVYDAAHGHNEMHRYSRSTGKEPGAPFHGGTLGEGMRAAIAEVEHGYRKTNRASVRSADFELRLDCMTLLDWLSLSARFSPRLVSLLVVGGLLLLPHETDSLLMSAAREEGRQIASQMERAVSKALGDRSQHPNCARHHDCPRLVHTTQDLRSWSK